MTIRTGGEAERAGSGSEGGSPEGATGTQGGLVIIGNFDGVHGGHQALLADAAEEAARRSLTPMVLTFFPHPAKALGRREPPVLTSLDRKIALIARVAPTIKVIVLHFDERFAAQGPEEFAERVLVGELSARVVFVGQNFRFGKGRAGDFAELARLGGLLGFETRSYPLVADEGGPWSSTRIREAIAAGDLGEAARLLGRPHMIVGKVVRGDQRGRTLGFPTCNLEGVEEELPPFGVYAVLVDRVEGGTKVARALARGVANVGVRPTVKAGDARPTIEVHLLDHAADLYGERLRVHLIARLRPERKFSGVDELKAQIARDVEGARARLAGLSPDPAAEGAWC